MRPTIKRYRHRITIALLVFIAAVFVTKFLTESKLNKDLQKKYNQLTNTLETRIAPANSKQKDSISVSFFTKPAIDSLKNHRRTMEKNLLLTDTYKDSARHALIFYMQLASKFGEENEQLKQTNTLLITDLKKAFDTLSYQRKIIAANGYYKDAVLSAHLKPANKFDSSGEMIYDSSNFKYAYESPKPQPQKEIVQKNVLGLKLKQEQIDVNGIKIKEPFATFQWQALINTSYRLAKYNKANPVGINIGTGMQVSTLGINGRLAVFYSLTQPSGKLWQRTNLSLQTQIPLHTHKIR